MAAPRWNSDQVELAMSNLLRIGVLSAAGVAAAGGAVWLASHGSDIARYDLFRGEPATFTTLGGIARGALTLDSRAITQLGMIMLIATPIARVVFSLVAFLLQRDRLYIVITGIVLAVLLFSFVFGGG